MQNAPGSRGVFYCCASHVIPVRAKPEPGMTSRLSIYSSPCAFGMSWVGAICGAGLAGTVPVAAGATAAACVSVGFGAGAAAGWTGADAGLAAIGLAFGTGTVRLATCVGGLDGRGAAWT